MRVGQVVGKVVLNRVHPSLVGAQFKIVIPLTFDDLTEPSAVESAREIVESEKAAGFDEVASLESATNRLLSEEIPRKWGGEVVVYDDLSTEVGEWVAFSEGAEAAAAFGPKQKPVDAFCGAIIDSVVVDSATVDELNGKKN